VAGRSRGFGRSLFVLALELPASLWQIHCLVTKVRTIQGILYVSGGSLRLLWAFYRRTRDFYVADSASPYASSQGDGSVRFCLWLMKCARVRDRGSKQLKSRCTLLLKLSGASGCSWDATRVPCRPERICKSLAKVGPLRLPITPAVIIARLHSAQPNPSARSCRSVKACAVYLVPHARHPSRVPRTPPSVFKGRIGLRAV
jgi:hypothetical protein